MSQTNTPKNSDLIEESMKRAAKSAAQSDAAHEPTRIEHRSAWRREQDHALKLRLEQLKTAQGHRTASDPTTPASVASPFSKASHPTAPWSAQGYSPVTLMLVSLLSAIFGAALMWLSGYSTPRQPVIAVTQAQSSEPPPVTEPSSPPPTPEPAAPAQSLPRDMIEQWRQAWSSRNVTAYLSHYAPSFLPANGQARETWATGRERNFAAREFIEITVKDLRIDRLSDTEVKAFFLQDYVSGKYRETAQPKTLLLQRSESGWQIAGEWEGDHR